MFELECFPLLQVQKLVNVAQVLLCELVVVSKSHLPLSPGHIIAQISINCVVSLFDLFLTLGYSSFFISSMLSVTAERLEAGFTELEITNLSSQALVYDKELLLCLGNETVICQRQDFAEHQHAQVLKVVQFSMLEERANYDFV